MNFKLKHLDLNKLVLLQLLRWFTPTQISYFTIEQIQFFTCEQIKALLPNQIRALTNEQLRTLTPSQVRCFSNEQIAGLKNENLISLITRKNGGLNEENTQILLSKIEKITSPDASSYYDA
jgi:hypothetical protein